MENTVVNITLQELLNASSEILNEKIGKAFGSDGLGLLTISEVSTLAKPKESTLSYGRKLYSLSDEEKQKITDPESGFSFGWSHGKEIFKGKPDLKKCSFYANPQYDLPYDNPELIEKYPYICRQNVWPESLPQFKPEFQRTCDIIINIGHLLIERIDSYIKSVNPQYPDHRVFNLIKESRTHKSRLLHYLPSDSEDDWCGWHNDHGALTGLLPPIYYDDNGNKIPNPDPNSGLWVASRDQKITRVEPSDDVIIFQIGETYQILSGAVVQATPHCVKSPRNAQGVSRSTLATFMDIHWDTEMSVPPGTTNDNVLNKCIISEVAKEVPSLASRWTPGESYHCFSEKTYQAYLNK